jgi:hypothetical protein
MIKRIKLEKKIVCRGEGINCSGRRIFFLLLFPFIFYDVSPSNFIELYVFVYKLSPHIGRVVLVGLIERTLFCRI